MNRVALALALHKWNWLLLVVAAGVLITVGCRTTDTSGTGSMAFVAITNCSLGAASGATIDVFENNGYKLARRDKETLVFEKPASKMNDLAYGNWMEAKLWDRVKVHIKQVSESIVQVHCTGYMVRDKGGATEEEVKPIRRGAYQKLLDQVVARFSAKPNQ